MYIVPIAWMYVTVMMAIVEANSPTGTLLGAFMTLMLYGLLPISIVLYIMGAPARKRAVRAREAAEHAAQLTAVEANLASGAPDGHGQTPADAVAPVRKEA